MHATRRLIVATRGQLWVSDNPDPHSSLSSSSYRSDCDIRYWLFFWLRYAPERASASRIFSLRVSSHRLSSSKSLCLHSLALATASLPYHSRSPPVLHTNRFALFTSSCQGYSQPWHASHHCTTAQIQSNAGHAWTAVCFQVCYIRLV